MNRHGDRLTDVDTRSDAGVPASVRGLLACVLGGVAMLLWGAGIGLLVLVLREAGSWGEHRSGDLILTSDPPTGWLVVAVGLIGLAGLLTGGLAGRHLRRRQAR